MIDLPQDRAFKYWAFISYSHADKKWGDWLHKALETYRVPPRFVGKDTGGGSIPKRLTPIFRDKDELSSSADLGRIINEALEQSRALIVICSPAAAQSRWVNEEVLAFKRLGRADRIFALIVEGEPEQSFPQALKFHLNADGTLSDRPAEPIAADARKGQDSKADAKLRLLAGLMGVSYDELKQRERQRRRKQFLITAVAAVAAVLVTAGLVYRSERALRNWKGSAPAYYAQAEALLSKANRVEALEKINAAIALQPERADFHFLRGNILQSSDLKQALQAYEETLRLDPNHARAKQNRDICAKVISDNPNATVLPDETMFEMIAQIMGRGRPEEARQMIKDFAALKGVTEEEMWRNRIVQAGLTGSGKDWFKIDGRGAVSLSFNKSEITNIHVLRGMPLEELILAQTSFKELASLKSMPLKKLIVSRTLVSDITPLAGMPLEELSLAQTSVKDIAILKGAPLRRLNLGGCKNIRDLIPLAECEELRDLILPPNATDIEFLRRLPSLERISYKSSPFGLGGWTPSQTAEEFWKNPHPASSEELLNNLAEDATEASFSTQDISDLSQLAGRPIRRLSLSQTKVTDLTPLSGMPLEELTLSGTSVKDIAALKGMPLRRLNLGYCNNIRDLTPLAECKKLLDLVLPPNVTDIEFLRQLPSLERISYKSTKQGGSWIPSQTAEEFWKNPHPALVEESVEEMLSNMAEDATEVNFSERDISDLSRLTGRPIRRLSLSRTKVADVTPLAGMPLEELTLSQTSVRDVTPLKGMPLRRLNLGGCKNIRDLTPLAECDELRDLILPPNAIDIELLRRLPNVERISYQSTKQGRNWTPSQTAEEFWKNPHPAPVDEPIEKSIEEILSNLAVDATEVSFSKRDISDLSRLTGRPIRRLSLSETKVTDLTPLAGMPLEELTLSGTSVSDITVLNGLPLRRLNLARCERIRDLTPLAGCKELRELVLPPRATDNEFLRRLPNLVRISYQSTQQGSSWIPSQTAEEFWKNPHPASSADSVEEILSNLAEDATEVSFNKRDISDLSPLAGRPIRRLGLSQTKVTDLTPLAGMPLEELTLTETTVRDVTPLKGMPLRRLNLEDCENIRDLTSLAECEELRDLVLPPNATDIEFLRRLPNLDRISYQSTQQGRNWTPSQTAKEFWKNPHSTASEEILSKLAVDATEVSFSKREISDLSGLTGRPIRRLSLSETKVTDLTPLAGMPLEELTLSGTSVRDITVLKDTPLRRLNLNICYNIRDLTPLAECKELRELVLPPNAIDIEFLRLLPNLGRISYKSTQQGGSWTPSQTAGEFWKEYDARLRVPPKRETTPGQAGMKAVTSNQ